MRFPSHPPATNQPAPSPHLSRPRRREVDALGMSVIYRSLCSIGDRVSAGWDLGQDGYVCSCNCVRFQVVYPLLPKFAQPAWNHAAGPKTVFFWAPTIKWVLIGAGLADLARPANKLSVYQVPLLLRNSILDHPSLVERSPAGHWEHLDTLLPSDHPRQLLPRQRELLRRLHWACAVAPGFQLSAQPS
jgi:Mitochondrial pyruvate carriers